VIVEGAADLVADHQTNRVRDQRTVPAIGLVVVHGRDAPHPIEPRPDSVSVNWPGKKPARRPDTGQGRGALNHAQSNHRPIESANVCLRPNLTHDGA
jgi:hypothetical protein